MEAVPPTSSKPTTPKLIAGSLWIIRIEVGGGGGGGGSGGSGGGGGGGVCWVGEELG